VAHANQVERRWIIEERSRGSSNRSAAVAIDVPCEAQTRRKIPPAFPHTAQAGIARIMRKVQARRGVREVGALDALFESFEIEVGSCAVDVVQRKKRFPAETVVDRQFLIYFPRIRDVHAEA